MSTSSFIITEHKSPCSYIRQYPHGVKRDDAVLELAVKEYRPRTHLPSDEEGVTIIAAHGNGFPKEMFEPLWDDLLRASEGFKIASIWAADVAHQGASYALNSKELGDDPNWTDHSLDLLLMINKFRERMKPPFIGIGHSMGCGQLVYLASIHPRLFHDLILIDPILQVSHPPGPNSALFSSKRRESWESRAKAQAQISGNGFFSSMDPRALKLFLQYALKDTPDGGVTLSTPKAQEAWTYVRSCFHDLGEDTPEGRQRERMLNPYIQPFSPGGRVLTARGEMHPIFDALPRLRPRTFFMYGEYSHINFDEVREIHISTTGTGEGGNGGAKENGVKDVLLEDCGHLCAFEKPTAIAENISSWLSEEVVRWKQERDFWATVDTRKSTNNRTELSDKWLAVMKEDTLAERQAAGGKAKL
ncbi:Alpha/beta hydrolase family-domain-containing protein [Paraphoma chrysanthemicola]|uniref:Alpha/beta hydrolase family-domain-containing protein n=1 Tax=Paraphoma chrysanthemicola TaxID=798071 RepID=A0A8K0QWD1_9PLEO|nr:Alpha/beta hydrolase family-domain-containing protein [Paraphoma chrysanthemicola]